MKEYKCKSPILLITFIKEKETKQVFETIRQVKPDRLYIASDGARDEKQGEKEKVENLRNWLVSNVDWNCEVKTKFSGKNLGCGHGPANAISWFFENEEMGIILEDDILADISFFRFCDELLEKYKDDDMIGEISGCNMLSKESFTSEYFFTKCTGIWGWATWRRVWADFDFTISTWKEIKKAKQIYQWFSNKQVSKIFFDIFNKTYASHGEYFNTWDYQWMFCMLSKNRLTIMPCSNLVTNIGFTNDSTHTSDANSLGNNLERGKIIFPIVHPQNIANDNKKDGEYYSVCFQQKSFFRRLLCRLLKK